LQKKSGCDYKFYGRHSRKFKFAGLAAYSSSKGAVITLSELLAEEYKEQGISLMFLHYSCANRNAGRSFSRLSSAYTTNEMANYIYDFTLNGNKYFNGKVQVSSTNP
jgi:NAD(P)-dependent dehydrogenase (short-subunit alcohol dehydrogenase family)